MKLYHWTTEERLPEILQSWALKPAMDWVYFSDNFKAASFYGSKMGTQESFYIFEIELKELEKLWGVIKDVNEPICEMMKINPFKLYEGEVPIANLDLKKYDLT